MHPCWSLGFLVFGALACGAQDNRDPERVPVPTASVVAAATPTATPDPSASVRKTPEPPAPKAEMKVALAIDTPVDIEGAKLRATMVDSFHKIRAPLVGFGVLFRAESGATAQVSWRIESGKIPARWRPLEGSRYDDEKGAYVDEKLPGWLVRLESIDDSNAGGSPTKVTISVKVGDAPPVDQ